MTMSDRIAVMRSGRVDQLGTAEDLYERPSTEFVAGFLGVSNLLEGRIVDAASGHIEVELDAGQRLRAAHERLPTGTRVKVGVRPEKVRLRATDASTDAIDTDAGSDINVLEGKVTDASYVGVSTQYVVRLVQGQDVVVYAQNLETSGVAEQHQVGQLVRLTWQPKHTFVIGSEAGFQSAGGSDDQPTREAATT